MIEQSEGWWIGWLVDLPGVNAQEKTSEELLESLKTCAEDMLDIQGIHDPHVEIVIPSAPRSDVVVSEPQERSIAPKALEP